MALGYIELRERAAVLRVEVSQAEEFARNIESGVEARRLLLTGEDPAIPKAEGRTRGLVEKEHELYLEMSNGASERLEALRTELAGVEADLAAFEPTDLLTVRQPAHQVAAEDIGVLAADLEPLLLLADRFVEDDTKPPDVRAAVETRARTLRGELRLFGDEPHDAIIITRSTAYLIATLTPQVIEDAGDALPDDSKAALEAVADGATEVGDDDTAVEGATTIAGALDPPDPDLPGDERPYRDAARRGLANWIENDLFKIHLNRIITAGITTAGGVSVEATTGGVSAILRAGRAVLRARFPWIFP